MRSSHVRISFQYPFALCRFWGLTNQTSLGRDRGIQGVDLSLSPSGLALYTKTCEKGRRNIYWHVRQLVIDIMTAVAPGPTKIRWTKLNRADGHRLTRPTSISARGPNKESLLLGSAQKKQTLPSKNSDPYHRCGAGR